MSNRLTIVAVAGFAIGIVCLASAYHLGKLHGFNIMLGRNSCGALQGGSVSRALTWNGGDTAEIDLAGTVHYRAGSGTQVVVSGDPALVAHVRVAQGRVSLDCNSGWSIGRKSLDVTLPGRAFRAFTLAGSGTITLENIDQPDLSLTLMGSGDVIASGRAGALSSKIMGSGDARLGALAVRRADVTIMGSGDTEIAPSDEAHVLVMGSGSVTLRTEPQTLSTHIMGSGSVIHAANINRQAEPSYRDNSR